MACFRLLHDDDDDDERKGREDERNGSSPELTLSKLATVIVLKFNSETFYHTLHIPTNELVNK